MTRRELLMVVLAVVVAIALLPAFGGAVLWTRPLWMDELITVFHADLSSPADVISSVANGSDYNPPLLHLIVWTASRLAGDVTPALLRSISLVCVALAVVVLYATLRRRFDRVAGAAGSLAVAGHALVIQHAFEGRFYGPWLLFAMAFAWSVGVDSGRARCDSTGAGTAHRGLTSREGDAAVAISAVLLCTIHWFGVVSLGLMCAAVVLAHGRPWREGLRLVAPAAAGLVALLAMGPLLLLQRSHAAELLWIPKVSIPQLRDLTRIFFWSAVPLVAALVLLVRGRAIGASAVARERDVAALAALAFVPVVLLVFSLVVQPAMLDRYLIVTVLAWAPLAALAASGVGRAGRVLVILALVNVLAANVASAISDKRRYAVGVARFRGAFDDARRTGLPVVFQAVHTVFPVGGPLRSERSALFLELPDSTISALYPEDTAVQDWLRGHLTFERAFMRLYSRKFGFPVLISQAQLDSTPRFLLMSETASLPLYYTDVPTYAAAVFPNHSVQRLAPNVTLLERKAAR